MGRRLSRVRSFGEFRLDKARCTLTRGGHAVAIEPQSLRLLEFLIHERHRVW